ncbi:Putative uncharacterized protein [Moritella viscosa]|uniref:Uncharacterized protein n=1 Tax=Moritella viscosa TaxID=80854 RepID=A0A1L0ABV1_9GAMM|nr:Putative uncharacterized protein [Moritella viscosa]SGZ04621.1 Putative uncharacterized protein [Moritella viscosa]SGZ05028.1 Putative uncharacterized protein [Moritella viscosa]SGZ11631.1 Putative uncharacterized protein [Moritella viscosa]SGZ11776.1 Putative uncharacterized protein [Moritella viscosa]
MYVRSYYLQQLSLRQLKTPNLKKMEDGILSDNTVISIW